VTVIFFSWRRSVLAAADVRLAGDAVAKNPLTAAEDWVYMADIVI
jgi:hypothetical protein